MTIRNFLFGTLITALFLATFYFLFLPDTHIIDLELQIGQTLPQDLVAPVDFSLPYSDSEFQEIREAVLSSVPIHLSMGGDVWDQLAQRLYPKLYLVTFDSTFSRGMVGEIASLYAGGVFSLDQVREFYGGEQAVIHTGQNTMDVQLFDLNEINDVRETLEIRMGRWDLTDAEMDSISHFLRPNLTIDDSSRQANARSAVAGISNIDTTITAGSVILPANDYVTERTLEYLQQMKSADLDRRGFQMSAALVLLALVLTGLVLFYVHELMPDTWSEVNRFLLLGVIWTLSLAATGMIWVALKKGSGYPYATMVTFGAALTSIFFHRRHAIIMSLVFSLLVGLVHPHPFSVVLIAAVSGSLTALTVWDVRERRSVPLAIGLAAGGGIGCFLLLRMLETSLFSTSILESSLALLIVPVIGIGSANSLIFIFERVFGVFTVLSIDEVNKTDHPLLKRMREVAPGTWNHSQTVAELAGRAAGAINAWESLASAGGYFHDIGKMKDPGMFIENQMGSENPHDDMNPWMSARKIIRHVSDGVSMGEKAKLPRAVLEIITQHHGTSLARFFYNRAVTESGEDSVDPSDFSYSGPRPQTVEAALVLLADQVASATRNLTAPEEVGDVVARVVDEKDLEGELDDCHLTRRNLKTIIRVFTSVLESKFYKRVEDYPGGDISG